MGYRKKTYRAGNTVIVEKGYTGRQRPHGCSRAKKIHPTPEAMKRQNEWNAVKKLTLLMNANFGIGDYHTVLTYRQDCRPTAEEAHKHMDKFIRRLRRNYRRAGQELKYIHTTEYKNTAIHHHALLNKIDIAQIQAAWPHGMVRVTPVYSDNLQKLAEYFIKETRTSFKDGDSPYKQRYVPSKNLVHPEAKVEEVTAKEWRQEPKEISGYYIDKDSVVNGISEVTGYPYQYYILVELPSKPNTKRPPKLFNNAKNQP